MRRGDMVTVAVSGDYGKPCSAVIVQSDAFPAAHPSVIVCQLTSDRQPVVKFRLDIELIPTRVEADTPRKAGGFAPSTPTGVPPGSQALRGTRALCRAALETPAARRSGVQGVKPPAFFEESNSTRVGISPQNGLRVASQIMVDKPVTVDRKRIRQTIGRLAPADVARLNTALAWVVGLGG